MFGLKTAQKNMKPAAKRGDGGVMPWGCFSTAGTGVLLKTEGINHKQAKNTFLHENNPEHNDRVSEKDEEEICNK